MNAILDGRKVIHRNIFACFIDFKKAFDSVNRRMLWHKIEHNFGIKGQFLKALYEKVSICVKVNNEFSNWFDVDSGVKQGCVLSPTLLSMFINDLVDEIKCTGKGIRCGGHLILALFYADDVVVFGESEKDLQEMLTNVAEWCNTWGININLRLSIFVPREVYCPSFSLKLMTRALSTLMDINI